MKSKKTLITILSITAIFLIGCVLLIPQRTDMAFVEAGQVTFVYDGKNIHTILSEEDLNKKLLEIIDFLQYLYYDLMW